MEVLTEAGFDRAVALLDEGFPDHGPGFWRAALARLQRYGGNAEADFPLGFLMLDGSEAVGVVLTPASLRQRADGSRHCIVNLSSWYVRPAFRWRAGFMLRRVMADRRHTYTDLTATPALQSVLPKLGMQPVNPGVLLNLLPLQALRRAGGARVRALAAQDKWPDPACEPPAEWGPPRHMVEAHRALGCLPLVLQWPQGPGQRPGQALVILLRTTVRGLPAVQLVYAHDRARVRQHLGALARWLLGQGVLMLVCEADQPRGDATALFRPREVWFALGAGLANRTDVFASELSIIHGQAARAAPA